MTGYNMRKPGYAMPLQGIFITSKIYCIHVVYNTPAQ